MGNEQIVTGVMDRWKAAIDGRRPQEVAATFTADAVFQGLRPYTVGRSGVADYYASQPPGMTVQYAVNETRRLADDVVLGYLTAAFSFPDRPTIRANIGVVLKNAESDWQIAFYEAALVSD